MSPEAQDLLKILVESYNGGAFAVACHGSMLKAAHELEAMKYAEWKGTSFGSNFYSLTEHRRMVA